MVIACGALGGPIRDIAARRGWPIELHCLPALLHNRPAAIAPQVERLAVAAQARGLPVAIGYADCGTYGALDELSARLGLRRLPGLHCYDLLAGPDRVAALFEAEPGTYVLTDFLVRSFRRTVLAGLGLDRYPELWPDYFGHYRRLVWLAQSRDPALDAEAEAVAAQFGLPLTVIDTGLSRLERELEHLLAACPGGPQFVCANRCCPGPPERSAPSVCANRCPDDGCTRAGGEGDGAVRGGLLSAAPLLAQPRYEVFPSGSVEQAVADWVPPGMTVTVTASPARGLDPTLDLTERLTARGYRVVPHLSARLVADDAHLDRIVARLLACGVDDVFVPAGDADPPAGQFDSALSLLTRLTEMGRPFARVGITGYPESHPHIDDDITVQAMWDKRHHSSYIVSNLCFDPAVLRNWVTRIRARGVTLPLYVGLAGPVERARLLRMAARAGVAESTRFLTGHADWFLRLGLPGGYSPERLLDRTGAALTAPGAAVAGLHLFTFNQVRQTEEWRAALLRRLAGPDRGRLAI